MVFDPGFPGFDHGIENSEQFAHGGDEGDLLGFADCAQAPVESADHRVVAGVGQQHPGLRLPVGVQHNQSAVQRGVAQAGMPT